MSGKTPNLNTLRLAMKPDYTGASAYAWRIYLKNDGKEIGEAGFYKAAANYSMKLWFDLDPEYIDSDLAFDAIYTIVNWAYDQKDVYFVEIDLDEDEFAKKRLLDKLEFAEENTAETADTIPSGKSAAEGKSAANYQEGLLHFVKEKYQSRWFPLYMCLGLAIGIAFAQLLPSLALPMGMLLGTAIGFLVGSCVDSSTKKNREEIRKQWKQAQK